jgi:hypothetical protein
MAGRPSANGRMCLRCWSATASATNGYSPARTFRAIAEIPVEMIEAWAQVDGIDWWALSAQEQAQYLRKKVADPDWKGLRNSPGKI